MRTFDELAGMTLMVAHRGRLRPVGTIEAVRGVDPTSHLDSPHIDIELPSTDEAITIHAADFEYMERRGRFAVAENIRSDFVDVDEQPGFHPTHPPRLPEG